MDKVILEIQVSKSTSERQETSSEKESNSFPHQYFVEVELPIPRITSIKRENEGGWGRQKGNQDKQMKDLKVTCLLNSFSI